MAGRLLAINYHYVRPAGGYPHPGIYPVTPEDFRAEMEALGARHRFATPAEAEAFASGTAEALDGDSILVTFDDGLVDHYRAAVETLNPLGIKAIFFLCSRPALEGRALVVQKTHWLRAHSAPEDFVTAFAAALPPEWRTQRLTPEQEQAAAATYVFDSAEHARLKYLINFVLPVEAVDSATSQLFRDRGESEADFCEATYMSAEQIGELRAAGHAIAVHGHDHRPVSRLEPAELDEQIRLCRGWLGKTLGEAPAAWYAYPYGREWSLPAEPDAFLQRYGFAYGLTMVKGWNLGDEHPGLLRRIAPNQLAEVGALD